MSRKFRKYQAAFVAGELSDTLHGRTDLEAYYLGAAALTNTIGLAQGDIQVRPGAYHVGNIAGDGRLASFDFADGERYIVIFTDERIQVYDDATTSKVADITGPYTLAQLDALSWSNVGDTLLIAHPEVPLKALVRGSPWAIGDYAFEEPPQYRYAPRSVTLTPGATTGNGVTLTASAALFQAGHVGTQWKLDGNRVTIASVSDGTTATIDIIDDLDDTDAESEWTEQAHSSVRGYYRTVAYTDGRLVFGGTAEAPTDMWFSRVGAPYDFFQGPSLEDDDPFSLSVSEGRLDPIIHLQPGTAGIEVFTTGAEGLIPFDFTSPLTPSTASYKGQTRYGARPGVKPVQLDAQTIFCQERGGALREFVYSEVEQAYSAVPLTVRATHLVTEPRSMTVMPGGWGTQTDFLLIVNDDGTIACMSSQRSESVAAWRGWTSQRQWRDVVTVGRNVYVITTDGDGGYYLEWFNENARFDSQQGKTGPATDWTGATHLADQTAQVYADEYDRDEVEVDGSGAFTTSEELTDLQVGLAFQPVADLLPPDSPQTSLSGRPKRPVVAYVTVKMTEGLRVQILRGGAVVQTIVVPDRPFDGVTTIPPQEQSGVKRVFLRGWDRDNRTQVRLTREGSGNWRIIAVAIDYAVTA
jgi:hypothetical protein